MFSVSDVITVTIFALSTFGGIVAALMAAVIAVSRWWLLGQFRAVRESAAAGTDALRAELTEFKASDLERHRESNEKIDALRMATDRATEALQGEIRVIERKQAQIDVRVTRIEERCGLFHAIDGRPEVGKIHNVGEKR